MIKIAPTLEMLLACQANVLFLQMSEILIRPSNPGRTFSIVTALAHDPVLRLQVMFEPFAPVRSVVPTNFAEMVNSGIIEVLL